DGVEDLDQERREVAAGAVLAPEPVRRVAGHVRREGQAVRLAATGQLGAGGELPALADDALAGHRQVALQLVDDAPPAPRGALGGGEVVGFEEDGLHAVRLGYPRPMRGAPFWTLGAFALAACGADSGGPPATADAAAKAVDAAA